MFNQIRDSMPVLKTKANISVSYVLPPDKKDNYSINVGKLFICHYKISNLENYYYKVSLKKRKFVKMPP
jgi:hypothetical protein